MIWSVSTLARSSGATRPVKTVNRTIRSSPPANVDEVSGDRGRRGHLGAHEVSPAAAALAALEIAVRGRSAALARLEPVCVHTQAHGAAGFAPLEAGVLENSVKAFVLRLRFHQARSRHDHRELDIRGKTPPADDRRSGPQVFDARIRARADEHLVDADVGHGRIGLEAHVGERPLHALPANRVLLPVGVAYSIVQPRPPAIPILRLTASARSFAVTPRASGPSTRTSMFFIFFASRDWVESTCSTSDVRMPNARHPNAPCVLVCESPHTAVMP